MGAPLIIGIAAGIGIVIIAVSIAYEIRELSPEQVTDITTGATGAIGLTASLLLLFVFASKGK